MDLVTKKIGEIIPYENNPRKNDDAVESVIKSIQQCEYVAPIVVDENNVILAGHTRLKALKNLGYTECEVVVKSGLTEEQKCKYRLLDNKTAELSEWDYDKLEEELADLDFGDLDLNWNVDLTPEPIMTEEDVFDNNADNFKNVEYGDIFQLGQHKIMCGDSTDSECVAQLMGDDVAKLLFTSPPYGNVREYREGIDLDVDKISDFIPKYKPYAETVCVNLGLIFRSKEIVPYWNTYLNKAKNNGYKLSAWNVWDKGDSISIGQVEHLFVTQHEWIFVFTSKDILANKTILKKQGPIRHEVTNTTMRRKDGSMKRKSSGDMSSKFKKMGSVIHVDTHDVDLHDPILKCHPARFPVELPAEYIKSLTNENDSVIDCFCGSGTTLIACEQLNRKCYGMELDPKFTQIIIYRWEQYTGQEAKKIN